MSEEPITAKHIGDVTKRCYDVLAPLFGDQHHVSSMDRGGNLYAFEFVWPAYGAKDARRLKVVVSEAEDVGVENMVYPPPKAGAPTPRHLSSAVMLACLAAGLAIGLVFGSIA